MWRSPCKAIIICLSRWIHFLTGEPAQGGRWYSQRYDYFNLPFYVRENSLVAVGQEDRRPDYDYAEQVEFQLFVLQDQQTTVAAVYNTNAEEELKVHAARGGSRIRVTAEGVGKPWQLILRGIHDNEIESVTGAEWSAGEKR